MSRSDSLIISDAPGARTYRQLRQWITDGVLANGETLPSEIELAERLGVARITLRSTLQRLQDEGLIRLTGRKRTVMSSSGRPRSALRHSVVLLGLRMSKPVAGHRLPGWDDSLTSGILDRLTSDGIPALFLPLDDQDDDHLAEVLAERPLGVIGFEHQLPPARRGRTLRTLIDSQLPTVFYGDHREADMRPFDTVGSDHAAGSYALTRLLLERGKRRILRLWHVAEGDAPRPSWLKGRDAGFERAMREAGIEPEPAVIVPMSQLAEYTDVAFRHQVRTTAGYLAERWNGATPVDALMAVSDGRVPYCSAAARILGREVDVVGYDHYWGDIVERRFEPAPPLASMDKNNHAIGVEMARLLLDRQAGRRSGSPAEFLVPPLLVHPVTAS